MKLDALIAALELPAGSRVDQRVPKNLLVENGAPTQGDKRQINDGIEALQWVATLKPTSVGVAEYRDELREYLEIAVLSLVLRPGAKAKRLVELIHRAVPYLVVLLTTRQSALTVSFAHKRWSQGEAGKTVLDGDIVKTTLDDQLDSGILAAFLASLPMSHQSTGTLYSLYQGWMDKALAVEAARLTGTYEVSTSPVRAAARRDALRACAQLETQMDSLRAAARKEKQVPRQVQLNLELKRLQGDYEAARVRL